MNKTLARDFDDYAACHPKAVQRLLQAMRETIAAAAPDASETISYRIPAFRLGGILVWFGAHASHIGFYPGAAAMVKFKKELAAYKSGKGSVQFPFDEPLPLALIARIVKFRVGEHLVKHLDRQF